MHWLIDPAPVDAPEAAAMLRHYMREMADRYYLRRSTEAEVDAALAEDPSGDLAPPHGVFLLARLGGALAGCVGVRFGPAPNCELTRLYVAPHARGLGGGARLLAAAEDAARRSGAEVIRLDTRHDLREARALYAKHGFQEVPAFSDGRYAEHWFAKRL